MNDKCQAMVKRLMEEEADATEQTPMGGATGKAAAYVPPGPYDLAKIRGYENFVQRHKIDDDAMNILKKTPMTTPPEEQNFTSVARAGNGAEIGGSRVNPTSVAHVPAHAVS